MDHKKELNKRESLQGDWRVEVLFPISKIIEWLKKRKEQSRKVETEWIYDGCDCTPNDGYRSVPYCEEHYNPLIRVTKET
jgi:hypothetical protein